MPQMQNSSFFSNEDNIQLFNKFIANLKNTTDPDIKHIEPLITQSLTLLTKNAEFYDKKCQFNIKQIGNSLIEHILAYHNDASTELFDCTLRILIMLYRFLYEAEIWNGQERSVAHHEINNYFDENFDSLPKQVQKYLNYATYLMPAKIIGDVLSSPQLCRINEFEKLASEIEEINTNLTSNITKTKQEIKQINDGIEQIKTAYNFVGLTKGFSILEDVKNTERRVSLIGLIIIGIAMIAIPTCQLIFNILNINNFDENKSIIMYSIPSIVAIELILLYFFRVVLSNHRNITTQLLQIKQRTSLCQFIQNYADYSASIKKQDPNALNKFENLIFSGIVSNGDSLPSTLDGIEHVAKLVTALRGR